jgi:hypothetical protein
MWGRRGEGRGGDSILIGANLDVGKAALKYELKNRVGRSGVD